MLLTYRDTRERKSDSVLQSFPLHPFHIQGLFFFFSCKFLLLTQEKKKGPWDPWHILGVAAASSWMTRQLPLCHIMRSTHAAPGDTNEGATAPLALSSKSVSASHVLFIRLIMAALRRHLERAAAVLSTVHHSACSNQLPGETDEAGKR